MLSVQSFLQTKRPLNGSNDRLSKGQKKQSKSWPDRGTIVIIQLLKGAFIGLALVLPGLSAGTVILILGFYRQFLEDISTLNFKPYLVLAGGIAAGGLFGVFTISYLLEHFSVVITSFLLGMLLASVPVVINSRLNHPPLLRSVILGLAGFLFTWFYLCEPARTFTILPPGGFFHFFIGGTLASANMLLPGVSGSAVLIILNLYEDVILAISTWQWLKMAFFTGGFFVGFLILARLISALYRRYSTEISFLLAGMIIGSTRALLPDAASISFFIFAALGAGTVLYFTRNQIRLPSKH